MVDVLAIIARDGSWIALVVDKKPVAIINELPRPVRLGHESMEGIDCLIEGVVSQYADLSEGFSLTFKQLGFPQC